MDTNTAIAQARQEREAVLADAEREGFRREVENAGYVSADRMRSYLETLVRNRDYRPQIGDGATFLYPQDSYPYVVTRVSPSGKTAYVKPLRQVDHSTGHEPARFDGPFPIWSHTYTDEERQTLRQDDAAERPVRRTAKGWTSNGTPVHMGEAAFHRNYSY